MTQEYEFEGLGYRRDLENLSELAAGAQANDTFLCGDIDVKNLGQPMGLVDILKRKDQLRENSCAGNSAETVLEACMFHQSGTYIELSRQFAYVNGQRYAGISGDCGCTLGGVIKGLSSDGCPREYLAPYNGTYYTQFSAEARADAQNYKLLSYSPITEGEQLLEGLAKRVGGGYFGMCWTGQFRNPLPGGLVNEYYEQAGCGFHAVCFLDWSDQLDSEGYPRARLFNSHGMGYGDRGTSLWSMRAIQQALRSQNTTAYFLSDMKYIRPRFDFKKQSWTDRD
jgi:hypothetical protein